MILVLLLPLACLLNIAAHTGLMALAWAAMRKVFLRETN